MGSKIVQTSFELSDGRILKCEYGYTYWAGSYWNPPESDVGEPVYYLDGKRVEVDELPAGLDYIATKLYEAQEGEYNYSESDPEYPDYEPSDFDF